MANLILVFFLDKIGRRRIVLTGFTTQWVCLIVIGGLGQIQNRNAALNGFLIALACTWCKPPVDGGIRMAPANTHQR